MTTAADYQRAGGREWPLVIGSEGHVGRLLVAKLKETWPFDVHTMDAVPLLRDNHWSVDIAHPEDFPDLFTGIGVVYNCAARVGRLVSEGSKRATFEANVVGTLNLAERFKGGDVLLVHLSTSEVYGPADTVAEDATLAPNNWYGFTKTLGEQVLDFYRARYGLLAVSVRPFMLYGETETVGAHRSAMIRFASAIANGEEFEVHKGTRRGWLHLDDAVRFLSLLPSSAQELPPALNIGNPDVRPVEDLIPLMEAALGKEARYRVVDQPPQMTPVKVPDLTLQSSLGFEPRVTLEEGVERVCASLS